jgi:hypothetical protein
MNTAKHLGLPKEQSYAHYCLFPPLEFKTLPLKYWHPACLILEYENTKLSLYPYH